MNRGEIRLRNETLAVLKNHLISRGIPLPPGRVKMESEVLISDAAGQVLPSAGKILQRRPDGSVEWILMDILLDLGPQEEKLIFIAPESAPQPKVAHEVTVQDDGVRLTLSNGISEIILARTGGSLIRKLKINGKSIVAEGMLVDLEVVDGDDNIYRASLSGGYCITIAHQNRLRAVVKIEGKHAADDGKTFFDFALRCTLTAGSPDLTLEHTFYCREDVEGLIDVKAMRLVVPTTMDTGASKLLRQCHHGRFFFPRAVEIAEDVEIVASSVGDIDNYRSGYQGPRVFHPSAGGNVFIRNLDSLQEDWSQYPFHMRPGQGSGFRADFAIGGLREVKPVLGWKEKGYTVVTAFEHWRQLHPKSIAIAGKVITYALWPEWSLPLRVVRGVSKSHIIWLSGERRELTMDDVEEQLYHWEFAYVEPVDISFDPAWPAFCEVLECQHFLKYQPDKYPLLENLIEAAPAAGNPARHTYDRQPATGIFHFGCLINNDATSCSNNEDDLQVLFPLQHFLRTGQTYAWDYGKEAARHYMEVDFCEWSTDPCQAGGLIAHTGQHFIGCVYSSHQWAEGLLAYYYLSGDERARNVVVRVGDNHCYWAYHCTEVLCSDGREAGMPLVNLAAAYRLTGDEKYLAAARHIIQNFFVKWIAKYGEFKYPYPAGTQDHPHRLIRGYGDWSSFAGLYRLWEVTGAEEFKTLNVGLLNDAVKPGAFSLNDVRFMDFFAAWILGRLTGDMDGVIQLVKAAIPMLLRRGGHPLRRLHFLKVLDERGLIDDKQVGNRPGAI